MRLESDSLGTLELPDDVYYGIQSYRASKNFQISGTQVHPVMLKTFLQVKKAAALANMKAGALSPELTDAIVTAVDELISLDFESDQTREKYFIIDAYQAGAGTSQNMNANEVIANKANEILGHPIGSYKEIHPNDHVNMSQSTNDIYPTVMRLATLHLSHELIHELRFLSGSLEQKATEFDSILKAGRTHLQDAVPMRLGQEFDAYREIIDQLINLITEAQNGLRVLGVGGSAVGTGINVPHSYREYIITELQTLFHDKELSLSPNLFASMQSQLPMMIYSGALRASALELTRIMNDLRLLSSGPGTGLAEIQLPATQPGSSIMPGKINPSILEMGNQVFFKVLGNDTAMSYAMQAGQLELNVMMPVMAQVALESTHIMKNALRSIRERSIVGIRANEKVCERYVGQTSQIVTALNPIIGYARASELAKEALKENVSVLDLIKSKKILTDKQFKNILNLREMTEPK